MYCICAADYLFSIIMIFEGFLPTITGHPDVGCKMGGRGVVVAASAACVTPFLAFIPVSQY